MFGVNGVGKISIFKMLIGDILVILGEVFVDGYRWSVFSLVGYFWYVIENFGNIWFSVGVNLDLCWFILFCFVISFKNLCLFFNELDVIS